MTLNKAFIPGIIFIVLLTILVMRFGAIVLALTIIPSVCAYFFDAQPNKPTFKVVTACNLSSALPFLVPIIDLSLKKQYSEVGTMIEDPMVWLFIYCGAAAGWGMLYLARFVARVITLMHYEYGISVLEKKQELLIREWGDEIRGPGAGHH